VKYWEIIADKLSKAGFSLGWVAALDVKGQTIWIVDAHGYGKAFHRARRRNPESLRGTRKDDTRVRGEFHLIMAA